MMRSRQPKRVENKQWVNRIWLRFAPSALAAALSIALPQMFGVYAGAAPGAPAGFLFTVTTLDDHNDFVCDGTDCTLREAIQAANNAPTDDTIDFSVTGVINLLSALPDISDSVTIEGPGADMLTVRRNATEPFRIFDVITTGSVTFSGLTITGGLTTSNSFGAAIRNFTAGAINVNNCNINNNGFNNASGGSGAAISNDTGGTINVNDSVISQNSGKAGSGIHNSDGTLNVRNTTISDNHVDPGGFLVAGGIACFRGTVTVTNSTISGNDFNGIGSSGALNIIRSTISGNSGGGVNSQYPGELSISNSTITDNTAEFGGGIFNSNTANITNTTISSNHARIGGGIYNQVGAVNVTNCTIANNDASGPTGNGGGIYNFDPNNGVDAPGLFTVKSSIIALNTSIAGPDAHGPFTSAGFNLIGKTDNSTGFTQPTDLTGTITSPFAPGLDPNGLQDNGGPTKTIALVCGSSAIDKGTSTGLTGNLKTDQRDSGFPRTIDDPLTQNASGGDGADIGAFELMVCNHPPVAQCRNIQVSVGPDCQASITAAAVDNGSFDPDPGDSIVSRTLDNSGPFGLGPHTVTLTVTDTHGAMSSCTATVTVVDTTPPSITCPANVIIKTASPGTSTIVVNYPPPTASDNCPGVTVVCSPPSGSQFPLGSTTVTCTATDGAMNNATCTFTVTAFDVCLQDDSSRDTLLFNSQSGDYLFTRCGANALTLSGRGTVRVQGSIFTLEHYGSDRRVMAKLDNGVKRGTASVQYLPLGTTFTISDRNTTDNTCACP